VGFAREAGIGVSMGGILNILLDPVFMFCFFPKGMETMAVGAATMTSNVVVCIYYLILLYRRRDETVLLLSGKEELPDKEHIKDIFSVGIPAAAATLLFDLDFIVIDRLMAGFGDIPLAAVGIVLKAERLPLNVGIGLCQGMVPLASYNYASGNYKRMKESVHFSRLAGLVIAAGSVILYEIFAPSVIRFFIPDIRSKPLIFL
jgi:Na+-driven multidrug efflux pump